MKDLNKNLMLFKYEYSELHNLITKQYYNEKDQLLIFIGITNKCKDKLIKKWTVLVEKESYKSVHQDKE